VIMLCSTALLLADGINSLSEQLALCFRSRWRTIAARALHPARGADLGGLQLNKDQRARWTSRTLP
jgi:hypothetical protein